MKKWRKMTRSIKSNDDKIAKKIIRMKIEKFNVLSETPIRKNDVNVITYQMQKWKKKLLKKWSCEPGELWNAPKRWAKNRITQSNGKCCLLSDHIKKIRYAFRYYHYYYYYYLVIIVSSLLFLGVCALVYVSGCAWRLWQWQIQKYCKHFSS